MDNITFLFPGLGAQYKGMGKDVFTNFSVARHAFQEVSDISHKNITRMCFENTSDDFDDTENSSLCTFTHSLAIARVIENELRKKLYEISYAVAGHSMGQFSALHCSGGLSIKSTVDLLIERARCMKSVNNSGGMICIVGLNKQQIENLIKPPFIVKYASIANHNSQDQFVISGHNVALDSLLESAKNMGARLAKRLNINISAHCKWMQEAEVLFRRSLSGNTVDNPKTKWFSNNTGDVMENPNDIKEELATQITGSVKWLDVMEKFPKYNITRAYEIGPGKALTGLVNRANVNCFARATDNVANIGKVLGELQRGI